MRRGGTSVTVTGSGFATGESATAFSFGAIQAATASCATTTSCTLIAPPHKAGVVDVKATVNGVASRRNAPGDQFTYL